MSPNSALSQWPSDARRLEEPGVSAETATTRPKSPLEQPDKVTNLFRRIPTKLWVAPFPAQMPSQNVGGPNPMLHKMTNTAGF